MFISIGVLVPGGQGISGFLWIPSLSFCITLYLHCTVACFIFFSSVFKISPNFSQPPLIDPDTKSNHPLVNGETIFLLIITVYFVSYVLSSLT